MRLWLQPIDPLHGLALSAAAAALPLVVVLVVMGWLRKPGYLAAVSGLACSLSRCGGSGGGKRHRVRPLDDLGF